MTGFFATNTVTDLLKDRTEIIQKRMNPFDSKVFQFPKCSYNVRQNENFRKPVMRPIHLLIITCQWIPKKTSSQNLETVEKVQRVFSFRI